MFSPVEDRDKTQPGLGFTHKVGDIVTISSSKLGSLINMVHHCDSILPWTFGITSLYESLRRRNLL